LSEFSRKRRKLPRPGKIEEGGRSYYLSGERGKRKEREACNTLKQSRVREGGAMFAARKERGTEQITLSFRKGVRRPDATGGKRGYLLSGRGRETSLKYKRAAKRVSSHRQGKAKKKKGGGFHMRDGGKKEQCEIRGGKERKNDRPSEKKERRRGEQKKKRPGRKKRARPGPTRKRYGPAKKDPHSPPAQELSLLIREGPRRNSEVPSLRGREGKT